MFLLKGQVQIFACPQQFILSLLMSLINTYALLALVATAINIGIQDLTTLIFPQKIGVFISIVSGTSAGLAAKYFLDKRYIFHFQARDVIHDSKTFTLYCLMGLFTTAIFWAFELGFQNFYETKEMRYLGGVIGLAIGYLIKYQLDKKYVFRDE